MDDDLIPASLRCELPGCHRLGITALGGKRFCVTHKEGVLREGRKILSALDDALAEMESGDIEAQDG